MSVGEVYGVGCVLEWVRVLAWVLRTGGALNTTAIEAVEESTLAASRAGGSRVEHRRTRKAGASRVRPRKVDPLREASAGSEGRSSHMNPEEAIKGAGGWLLAWHPCTPTIIVTGQERSSLSRRTKKEKNAIDSKSVSRSRMTAQTNTIPQKEVPATPTCA